LLHGAYVNSSPQPAGGGGVSKAVQVPFILVETRARSDLFAPLVHKAEVDMAFRGREHEGAVWHVRMLAQDLGYFFGEWDGAFFPIFRQESILRFCPDMDTPVGKVKVRKVERLEFAAAKACREH